jgi:hypothetical protein
VRSDQDSVRWPRRAGHRRSLAPGPEQRRGKKRTNAVQVVRLELRRPKPRVALRSDRQTGPEASTISALGIFHKISVYLQTARRFDGDQKRTATLRINCIECRAFLTMRVAK